MPNIRLNKKVYRKEELEKSIDSSFKTFVDVVEEDDARLVGDVALERRAERVEEREDVERRGRARRAR